MTESQLHDLFHQSHAASRAAPAVPWPQRAERLRRLRALVTEHEPALAAAISADFGQRAVAETRLLEIYPTLSGIKHALKHGRRWMQPRKVATGLHFWPARSRIVPQPLGVVGIVAPWNYPLLMVTGPLIGALAAGNRVLVKVSEHVPQFAALLAHLLPQYFAADEVAVVTGDATVAAAFSALPFDHLFFTGSTTVGRHVMRAASANLTPVTLELGGKSPVVVLPDADIERTVARIMSGKLLNAGQTCIAPDYVLLPPAQIQPFIQAAKSWVSHHYPNLAHSPDYSRIINPAQFARLQGYLTDAEAQGAEITPLSAAHIDEKQRLLPPQILTRLSDEMQVMQQEIFGPLLPLVPYQSLDGALAYINARPRPLALYVFGQAHNTVDQVLAQTVAGGVCINETLLHVAQENLPFGGVGASGMGAYHGQTGFDTFSHLKAVFEQSRINGMHWFTPPYGARFEQLLKWLLKY